MRPSCLRPERGNRASATLLHYIHIHVFIIIIIREIIDAQPEKKEKKRFKSNHKSSDVGGGIFTKEKNKEDFEVNEREKGAAAVGVIL